LAATVAAGDSPAGSFAVSAAPSRAPPLALARGERRRRPEGGGRSRSCSTAAEPPVARPPFSEPSLEPLSSFSEEEGAAAAAEAGVAAAEAAVLKLRARAARKGRLASPWRRDFAARTELSLSRSVTGSAKSATGLATDFACAKSLPPALPLPPLPPLALPRAAPAPPPPLSSLPRRRLRGLSAGLTARLTAGLSAGLTARPRARLGGSGGWSGYRDCDCGGAGRRLRPMDAAAKEELSMRGRSAGCSSSSRKRKFPQNCAMSSGCVCTPPRPRGIDHTGPSTSRERIGRRERTQMTGERG